LTAELRSIPGTSDTETSAPRPFPPSSLFWVHGG